MAGLDLLISLQFNDIQNISDQIKEEVVEIAWTTFISKNYQNWTSNWPDVKNGDQMYQVLHRYGVSKTSVSLRYQLKCFCNVLSWSIWLRWLLVRYYDVSNWSALFTYQCDITMASQIGVASWRTSCNALMMSQHGPGHSN